MATVTPVDSPAPSVASDDEKLSVNGTFAVDTGADSGYDDDDDGRNAGDYDARLLRAKQAVVDFHDDLERAGKKEHVQTQELQDILDTHVDSSSYIFRSVHPFRDHLTTTKEVADKFWYPLLSSLKHSQRRVDLFFGGKNSLDDHSDGDDTNGDGDTFWIVSMGHFMGLFDQDWLGMRATRQMATLRYAEFSQVRLNGDARPSIIQTGLFMDVIGLMQDTGLHPLPVSTGRYYTYPGPRGHDGLWMKQNAPLAEGTATQGLVDRMVDDLVAINHLNTCSPDVLRKTWHEDMLWYGPAGIGASYTIPRYQEQHQLPFRQQLKDKRFCGHAVRVAEGPLAAFFGWPCNLTNTPTGGFLGLPGGVPNAPMQVVDVYRREGDKLAENWVLIDLPHYLLAQGLDVLKRTTGISNPYSIVRKRAVEETEPMTTTPAKKAKLLVIEDEEKKDEEVAPVAVPQM